MTGKHDDSCRRVEFPCCDDQMCPCDLMEFHRLQVENARLREALNSLANEAAGFLHCADAMQHGVTNMQVFQFRIDEARAAL